MISSECPECGEPVPIRAEKCSYCGTPNTARRGVVAIAVAIVLLVIAIGSAIYIATRPQTRMTADPKGASRAVVGEPRGISPPVTTDGSFGWIRSALTACDDLAAKQPAELHFIVIPLQAKPSDLADWQLLTVGAVGNGLSIPADDALGGLRRGTLSIYNEDYVFSARMRTRTSFTNGTQRTASNNSPPRKRKRSGFSACRFCPNSREKPVIGAMHSPPRREMQLGRRNRPRVTLGISKNFDDAGRTPWQRPVRQGEMKEFE